MALKIKDGGSFKSLGGTGGEGETYHLRGVTGVKAIGFDPETVRVYWKDPESIYHFDDTPIAVWAGTRILRKTGDYPAHPNDGTLVVDSLEHDQYYAGGFEDTELITDTEYYYAAFPYTTKGDYTIDPSARAKATPTLADDTSDAPGEKVLIAGTREAGFFGEVSPENLITGKALRTACNISSGTEITDFANEPWLKMVFENKILFIAKKPYYNSQAPVQLVIAGCMYGDGLTNGGDMILAIQGLNYRVRVLRGTNDPNPRDVGEVTAESYHGSEWNRLMLPLHIDSKTSAWGTHAANVEVGLPTWGIDYTNADLAIGGSGAPAPAYGTTLMERTVTGTSGNNLHRGQANVASAGWRSYNTTWGGYGWRPVLELIQD